MLFNQDMIAYRCKPAKTYGEFEYYNNGGADEIIFVFQGRRHARIAFWETALSRGGLHRDSARNYLPARAGQGAGGRLSHPGIDRAGAHSAALSESRRPDPDGLALFRARFSWADGNCS